MPALGIAGNSLDVLQQAIGVIQNNVTNATTPGYVTQTQELGSRAFNPSQDLLGGVETTGVQSARDIYAEQSVWSASQQSGLATTQSANLDSLQQIFNVSGTSGIPACAERSVFCLLRLERRSVRCYCPARRSDGGANSGYAFSQTVSQAQQMNTNNNQQLTASVAQLNTDSAQVATINGQIRSDPGGANDAGLQAQLYTTLQDMSTLAPVSVHIESDGTATVLLGGQAPLVMGTTQNNVTISNAPIPANAPFPNGASTTALTIAGFPQQNGDVTSLVNEGAIGAELTFANTTMPSLLGNSQTQGSLNQLAQTVADRVNTLLKGGQTRRRRGRSRLVHVPLDDAAGRPRPYEPNHRRRFAGGCEHHWIATSGQYCANSRFDSSAYRGRRTCRCERRGHGACRTRQSHKSLGYAQRF